MGKQKDAPTDSHVSGQANKPMSRPAHALTYRQVVEELGSNDNLGLTSDVAKKRLDEYGTNDFGDSEGVSVIKIVVAQIANAMTLVSTDSKPPRMVIF
jgi:P-type Na+/K+ transporter